MFINIEKRKGHRKKDARQKKKSFNGQEEAVLHQSVRTEDSSFSLSCYLITSQLCQIQTRVLKKKTVHCF